MILQTSKDPRQPLKITQMGFAQARANTLDIAAYLDRLARYDEAGDVRHAAIRAAIAILADSEGDKARRILERLSDPTAGPIAESHGQGAIGVWPDFEEA